MFAAAGKSSFFPYFRLGLGARAQRGGVLPRRDSNYSNDYFHGPANEDLSPNCGFPRAY